MSQQQQQQQQQGNQANNPQTQAQANLQQINQAQRQQQLSQMAQQQQIEPNIKPTQPNNAIQNNPLQNNPMQGQGQNINQAQGMSQMGGQQQWNFQNQINPMQGTSGQNQPASTTQPQQFFNQGGMNRFERPQMNNPTSKQALSMMLRQRHPSSFMNSANNPQQPNMGGLPFNIQQQRQQQLMRTAALRNVNPAQMQAANATQMNANNLGNPMMSGSGMLQQRQVTYFVSFSFYSKSINLSKIFHSKAATSESN